MTEDPRSFVTTAAEALRTNPLIVGVLLLNVLFVITAAWYLTHVESQHSEYLKLILERCLPKGSP